MRHSNKHIRKAVKYALENGWTLKESKGHVWGILYCSEESREGCRFSVYSTPMNAENHAKQIIKVVDQCPHKS